jgi:hypothetical protein
LNNLLNIVESDKYFWFVNGDNAKSLIELCEKLKNLDLNSFKFHANDQKNDFKNWIKEVIKDEELSLRLNNVAHKSEFVQIIEDRIKYLKQENKEIDLEIPQLTEHLKQRRIHQISELIDDINYKLIHHSDILDKYERIREIYKKLDKESKQKIYPEIVKTYLKLQELWNRINY